MICCSHWVSLGIASWHLNASNAISNFSYIIKSFMNLLEKHLNCLVVWLINENILNKQGNCWGENLPFLNSRQSRNLSLPESFHCVCLMLHIDIWFFRQKEILTLSRFPADPAPVRGQPGRLGTYFTFFGSLSNLHPKFCKRATLLDHRMWRCSSGTRQTRAVSFQSVY